LGYNEQSKYIETIPGKDTASLPRSNTWMRRRLCRRAKKLNLEFRKGFTVFTRGCRQALVRGQRDCLGPVRRHYWGGDYVYSHRSIQPGRGL